MRLRQRRSITDVSGVFLHTMNTLRSLSPVQMTSAKTNGHFERSEISQILTVLIILLLLFLNNPVQSQGNDTGYDSIDSEYQSAFGAEKSQSSSGSHTIEEAKRTGRGYRIGTSGVYAQTGPDVYTVHPGDTLWTITGKFYGDPGLWPKVWSFNPEITNPHWIFPSDQVRLVPASELQQASAPEQPPTAAVANKKVQPDALSSRSVYLRDMGYLDEEALKGAGQIIGSYSERMLLGNNDAVYIKFESGKPPQIGRQYSVYRTMNQNERSQQEQGTLVRVLGSVSIASYNARTRVAQGTITEADDPIERGCKVALVERQFELVPVKASTRELAVKIVALVRPREMISYNDFVFIDAGVNKGVEPGYRFFVARRGDRWRDSIRKTPEAMGASLEPPAYNPNEYPKEFVAELRVVKVHKTTALAFVTRSDIELKLGDTAESIKGY
jgi:hypothetical protein